MFLCYLCITILDYYRFTLDLSISYRNRQVGELSCWNFPSSTTFIIHVTFKLFLYNDDIYVENIILWWKHWCRSTQRLWCYPTERESCGSVVVKIARQRLIFFGLAPAEDGLEELLALFWGMLTILQVIAPVSLWPQWCQFLGLWGGLHFKQQQMKMSQHMD